MEKVEIVTRFALDSERATKIASILYPLFIGRKGIFEGYQMPEWILPRGVERARMSVTSTSAKEQSPHLVLD